MSDSPTSSGASQKRKRLIFALDRHAPFIIEAKVRSRKPTVSCPPDYVHQALSQRSLTGADYAARPGLRQFVVRPVKRRFRRILRFRVLWTPSPTLGLSRRRHAPARTRRLENGKPSLERMVIRAAAHRDPPVLTERAGASR